jgi:acetate kinase
MLQAVGDVPGGQAVLGLQPQQPGIDAAASPRHDQALERGEAHRGPDTAAAAPPPASMPAALALEVFCLRARQEIAAAAVSLSQLDAVVFSGEIGADQPEVRESVAAGLTVLGVAGGLDAVQDRGHVISGSGVPAVLLVRPDEQRQIAQEVHAVLRT